VQFAEAGELCQRATLELLELESGPERGLEELRPRYDAVARCMHTLKGTAGSLGLEDVAQIVHRMEDVVAAGRAGDEPLDSDAVDALLEGLDQVVLRVRAHAGGGVEGVVDLERLVDRLEGLALPAPAGREVAAAPEREEVAESEARRWELRHMVDEEVQS